jgi:hypothetical protein
VFFTSVILLFLDEVVGGGGFRRHLGTEKDRKRKNKNFKIEMEIKM